MCVEPLPSSVVLLRQTADARISLSTRADRSAAVSLTDVHYQPNGHLLTSSITGLIHVWDTKQSLSAPVMTFREYVTTTTMRGELCVRACVREASLATLALRSALTLWWVQRLQARVVLALLGTASELSVLRGDRR